GHTLSKFTAMVGHKFPVRPFLGLRTDRDLHPIEGAVIWTISSAKDQSVGLFSLLPVLFFGGLLLVRCRLLLGCLRLRERSQRHDCNTCSHAPPGPFSNHCPLLHRHHRRLRHPRRARPPGSTPEDVS